jgi:enoyl-CoA hydratase
MKSVRGSLNFSMGISAISIIAGRSFHSNIPDPVAKSACWRRLGAQSTREGYRMKDTITVERAGTTLKISLNRPDEGNIVSNEMVAMLSDTIRNAAADTKAIVLTGNGPDFCLGRDLSKLNLRGPLPEALALRHQNEVIFDCYANLRNSPVPVISAVRGRARGFGCALAGVADITLATSDAVFSLPEMGHGIMPGMAMSALVDRIPRKHLLNLVLSGSAIPAERAYACGLVTDVVEPDHFDSRLDELVASVSKASIAALRAVKEYTRSAYNMDTQSASDFARNLHVTINSSSELRAG